LYDSETGAKFLDESRKSTTNPWEHMGFWPGNLNMGDFFHENPMETFADSLQQISDLEDDFSSPIS